MSALRGSVHRALVLAAGNGDRFQHAHAHSKLTATVGGVPLLERTLVSARLAGITEAHLVLGFDAGRVRDLALSRAPDDLDLHFHVNPRWYEENGLSVLAARHRLDDGPFALLMGDHLFESRLLKHLLESPRDGSAALLAIDSASTAPRDVQEATKVRLRGDTITEIGKTLDPFDALDTGVFVCEPPLFAALDTSCARGDTTLSAGIADLARRGLVRGVDIGTASWCDVDTPEDLDAAEALANRIGPSSSFNS
jgi:1L-myo-inositol 1-phosphate cytidylyltransferase